MRKAILIHGWTNKDAFYNPKYPTPSNGHWLPWLSKQLIIRDIHAIAPEMPHSYYPEYEIWKTELERFPLDEETILVGHSCGGGFITRYLSENNVKVGKVVLVAPWLGITDETNPEKDEKLEFFDFEIDQKLAEKTKELVLFESTNDMKVIQESINILKKKIDNMKVVTLKDKGHFTQKSLGGVEFPELLNEIVNDKEDK